MLVDSQKNHGLSTAEYAQKVAIAPAGRYPAEYVAVAKSIFNTPLGNPFEPMPVPPPIPAKKHKSSVPNMAYLFGDENQGQDLPTPISLMMPHLGIAK